MYGIFNRIGNIYCTVLYVRTPISMLLCKVLQIHLPQDTAMNEQKKKYNVH